MLFVLIHIYGPQVKRYLYGCRSLIGSYSHTCGGIFFSVFTLKHLSHFDVQLQMQMTNEIGKALFSKAGELGVPVGIMCMKVLKLSELKVLVIY